MFLLVDLCQIVTFKLVDQKNVPIADVIKIIVDQKLLPPGDRIINLILDIRVKNSPILIMGFCFYAFF